MQTLRVDQLLGRTVGEYQIEQLLRQGQLGTAYLARQRSQGRTVIMTMFNFPEDISARERDQITTLLDQERATLVRLTHPYILPVYDASEHAGYLYLSNGNFVACERACTHAGVPVNYDPGSGQLVCPAHGAIFDPLHGFSHVSGPGNSPLATVSIRVNGDGTITTG